MRWLGFVFLLLMLILPIAAQAQQGINPGDIRLKLVLEERDHAPRQGEMILLSIQGTYKIPVIREKIRQPVLDGFGWMQLGEDRWYKEREDGFEVLKLERRMALFPEAAGPVEIPAFTHGLEMLGRNGRTVAVDEVSNTLTLDVAPRPEGDDWWFPLRAIAIEDSWSNQPEALEAGAGALRIVSLTVDGAEPQRIPPMPEMTGAGAFIFPHPEHRIVALGPDGPRTRVFWRWTVRPEEGSAGYTNPIRLAWFDTEAGEAREITLAAQRVAYAGGAQEVRVRDTTAADTPMGAAGTEWSVPEIPGWVVPLTGLLGLIVGLAVPLWSGAPNRWVVPEWLRPDPGRRALRRAVRTGDTVVVRNAAHAVLASQRKEAPGKLAELDRAIYGQGGSFPDLREVLRAVLGR